GVLVFGLVFSVQRTLSGLAIAVLIAIAPMILFMIRPSKEFFVMLLTLVALSVLCLRLPGGLRVMLVAGLYCVYAYYFRIYYYLIALGFVCLAVFVFLPRSWRPAAIVVALLTLVLVPDSIFMATQGTRDAVNELRYATGDIGSRTAFINLLEPTNEISFIINYIYSIVRLNLAILFNLNLKELFLTVNVFVYAWLLYRGLHMDRTARLAALLLLAHFMVLWLFEPDLGSYFRHLSSALVLLVPIMRRVEIDKVACLRKA
ncbi:MAG: hypothetical protein U9N14_06985, partial [Pseudomonadota bacterium]|nr:hypothetical protein [Pseudomonadota bacterium]